MYFELCCVYSEKQLYTYYILPMRFSESNIHSIWNTVQLEVLRKDQIYNLLLDSNFNFIGLEPIWMKQSRTRRSNNYENN